MREPGSDRGLVGAIRSAYEGSAEGWAAGPAVVYRRLADALLTNAASLAGLRVLDLGAGTGVASEMLVAAGARPIGVDLAWAMLAHRQSQRPPGVVGDAAALPFPDDRFDAVVAAFSLNHVADPESALGECRRVTRTRGLVLGSTFPTDDEGHPAKATVESVLDEFGYRRPDWYETFKTRIAARTGDPGAFAQAAAAAGLGRVCVDRVEVDAGLDDPDVAVAWRLNMPHTIGFVAGLDPTARAALRARATAALPAELPRAVSMLALRAQVL